jgi:hypothetical protein
MLLEEDVTGIDLVFNTTKVSKEKQGKKNDTKTIVFVCFLTFFGN